ncbi:aspartate/glutamate racemase family protein [Thermodesulfobacteriota bacterium]
MIGWRARFGIILPSVNTTTEPEIYQCLPDGVSAHFTRMEFKETTHEYFQKMIDDVPAGVRMLTHADVDAIVFACTSGSLYGGLGYDDMIISKIKENSDIPASTTSTAVIESFTQMGVKTLSVVTPYEDWVNDLEKKYFEANGIKVLNIKGLGLRGLDVCEVHPESFYPFVREHYRKEADAIFLSCMGLRTLEIIPTLEDDLQKPVISSNQATFWKLFRMCGIPVSEIKCDFGSLFKTKNFH